MITPRNTIDILNKLMLSDEEFRQIHHLNGTKRENETVQSHVKYLAKNKSNSFKRNKDNYVVALRLECIENFKNKGYDKKKCNIQL